MDVNKDMGTAAAFAQFVWVACGVYLYLTTPGSELLSGSGATFIIGGMFVSALVFGLGFHGLRNVIARALPVPADAAAASATRMTAVFAWLLPLAQVVIIFIAADLTFQRLETARIGLPIEYVNERNSFNGAIAAFATANDLEEQAKARRDLGNVDPEMEARVVTVIEGGIEQARVVSDPFLAYLDPELPERYRTQLVRGYELLVEGRRTGDLEKQTKGNELVREFYDVFLPDRSEAIVKKLGARPQ